MKQKAFKRVGKKICSLVLAISFMLTVIMCKVSAVSSFTVTGYITPDFIYENGTEANVLSDFVIAINGTQISCVTDATGYFKLNNVPTNTSGYNLEISKAGYLTRVISNISVSDNIDLSVGNSAIEIWAGDINGDNAINMSDVLEIAKAFNTVSSNGNYNKVLDLNRDISVNMTDIMILAKHFNTMSSHYSSNITISKASIPVQTPTKTVVPTPTKTAVPTPTKTVVPTPTKTAVPTPTKTAVPTPTKTVVPTPTKTVVPTPTKTVVPTPTKTVVPTPTKTVVPTPTKTPVPTPTKTPVPTKTPTPIPTQVLDDMNYVGDTKSIHIKKYEQGTGDDMITYYVADIKVNQGSDIHSAFAKNTFGLHITDKTTNIATENNAILAINGSYYGFREDGIEIRNGELYRDVPFRTGLAIYKNGTMESYTEADDSTTKLMENGVFQAISFGPVLVKSGTLITDFTNTVIDINSSSSAARRPIEGANPRTGIGMIEPNHFVFIVVDGRNPGYSRGATLTEFAKMFYDLGCKEAYNLDGGGSATMYFNGKIINQPSLGKERSISDILYLTK